MSEARLHSFKKSIFYLPRDHAAVEKPQFGDASNVVAKPTDGESLPPNESSTAPLHQRPCIQTKANPHQITQDSPCCASLAL
jgi:hypothetical protein